MIVCMYDCHDHDDHVIVVVTPCLWWWDDCKLSTCSNTLLVYNTTPYRQQQDRHKLNQERVLKYIKCTDNSKAMSLVNSKGISILSPL